MAETSLTHANKRNTSTMLPEFETNSLQKTLQKLIEKNFFIIFFRNKLKDQRKINVIEILFCNYYYLSFGKRHFIFS